MFKIKGKMEKIKIVIIACIFPAILAGCSLGLKGKVREGIELPFNFGQRIAELEKVAAGKGDRETRAMAHKEMALLYYQSAKPDVDYAKALKELENYIALKPEKSDTSETRDMLAVLRELESQSKKIGELTETINMLQSLDVELEKQRELMK